MNWTSEYVLALHSITLASEGSLLFLSHLLYRTHYVCLLMILSLVCCCCCCCLSIEFFFSLLGLCSKKIETCLCASNPLPTVIIIQVDCWLTTNWMKKKRIHERIKKMKMKKKKKQKKKKTSHLFIMSRKPIQDSITLFLSIVDWISIAWRHTHTLFIAVSYCRDETCIFIDDEKTRPRKKKEWSKQEKKYIYTRWLMCALYAWSR